MIYLIGGAPRVGKSTLAQRVLEQKKVPWISLDVIREMLFKAAPELNIGQPGQWEENPERFYPFLKELIHTTIDLDTGYTFEGDVFFPRHAAELQKEFAIKVCFLGTSRMDVKTLQDYPGLNNWLDDYSEEKLESLSKWIMDKSVMFEAECRKYNLPYFDVGQEREKRLTEAFHVLMA